MPIYAKVTDSCEVTAGEAITRGMLVSIHDADGLAYMANAGTGAGQDIPAIGIAETTLAAGEVAEIKRVGKMAGEAGLQEGDWCYLSTTDGLITQTAPAVTGDAVQVVGVAVSTTEWMIQIESHSIVT